MGTRDKTAPVRVVHDIDYVHIGREVTAIGERLGRNNTNSFEAEILRNLVRPANTLFSCPNVDNPLCRVKPPKVRFNLREDAFLVLIPEGRVSEERIHLCTKRLNLHDYLVGKDRLRGP